MKNINKKILTLISYILIIFFCSCSADETKNNTNNSTNNNKAKIIPLNLEQTNSDDASNNTYKSKAFVYTNENIIYLYGRKIKTISSKDYSFISEFDIDVETDSNVENILGFRDNKIYAVVNTFNFNHSEVDIAKKRLLLQYNLNGELENSFDLDSLNSFELNIASIEIITDNVFLFVSRYNSGNEIYKFNLKTNEIKKLEIDGVTSIEVMDDKLLISTYDGTISSIKIYDYQTEKIDSEYPLDISNINNVAYDKIDKNIYLLSYLNLYSFDISLGEAKLLYIYPQRDKLGGDFATSINALNGNLATQLNNGNMKIIENSSGVWDSDKTITVLAPQSEYFLGSLGNAAYSIFSEKYPNFRLSYVGSNDYQEYPNELAKKLMANDADFDIFTIQKTSYSIIKEEVFEDLNNYSNITKNFDEMLPGIKNLFSHNGKIFGAPLDISVNIFSYDQDKLKSYEIDVPKPILSMAEFENLFVKANDNFIQEKVTSGTLTFNYMFNNLLTKFNSEEGLSQEEIRDFYELVLSLYKKGALGGIYDFNPDGLFDWGFQFENENIISVPLLDNYPFHSIDVEAAAINPNSKNKEFAAEFLALMSSKEVETEFVDNMVFSMKSSLGHDHGSVDLGSEVEEISAEHAAEDEILAYYGLNWRYLFDRKQMHENSNYKVYAEILLNSKRTVISDDISSYARDIFTKLVEGEIDTQTAAENTYKKMNMIKNE